MGAAKKRTGGIVEEKLVLDWKRRQRKKPAQPYRVAVGTVLDDELPDVYGPQLFDQKADAIFDHIYASYFDNGVKRLRHTRSLTPGSWKFFHSGCDIAHHRGGLVNDDLLSPGVRTDPELFARSWKPSSACERHLGMRV